MEIETEIIISVYMIRYKNKKLICKTSTPNYTLLRSEYIEKINGSERHKYLKYRIYIRDHFYEPVNIDKMVEIVNELIKEKNEKIKLPLRANDQMKYANLFGRGIFNTSSSIHGNYIHTYST